MNSESSDKSRELGSAAERWALRYLYRRGYDILERNYRCRAGEIDLIGYDGPVLAFIEVKARSSAFFGTPGEALRSDQEERIRHAADTYRRSRCLEHLSFRFDIVAVDLPSGKKPGIKLIPNAF
jgi:putative endonuclease